MKLPAYNLALTISDPDDPDTAITVRLERVPREKVINKPMPLAGTLEQFEALVQEDEV